LAEKNLSRTASAAPGSNASSPEQSQAPSHSTPNEGNHESTPRSHLASPEPQPTPQPQSQKQNGDKRQGTAEPEQTEEEVEALSDMMCSLVTNNCGETRYIGKSAQWRSRLLGTNVCRIIFWILNFLAEGYTMGQSKDRRFVVPANDIRIIRGR